MNETGDVTQQPSPEGGDAAAPAADKSKDDQPQGDRVKALEAKVKELQDQVLRSAAEFDNYRKRVVRDSARTVESAQEAILRKLLGVVDNIERAVQHGRSATRIESLQEGNEALYSQCLTVLSDVGVTPMDALTRPFDHNLHEAISQQESPVHPDGTIVAVAEGGYMFRDRVLRHAKVVVSKRPRAADPEQPETGRQGTEEVPVE